MGIVLLKRSLLVLLLLALCVGMGMAGSAQTQGEFLLYGAMVLALV